MKSKRVHIDYYTATPDFDPSKARIYCWTKLKHFRKGNVILIRDSKNGMDALVRLIENPKPFKPEDCPCGPRWANQKFSCKYRVLQRDSKPYPEKKRSISTSLRAKVLARDENTCQICGQEYPEENLEVDHIKEFSQRGFTVSHNLLTLCKGDHKIKTNDFKRSAVNVLIEMKNSPNVR